MNRKTWLKHTSSTTYFRAELLEFDARNSNKDTASIRQTVKLAETLADTWKRERILCVPFSEKKFLVMLQERRIDYCRSEHVLGAFYCDFRELSEKTWERVSGMISKYLMHETLSTDSDVKYGATARLSPAPQKIKGTR
jgi:hypothetical protein